MKKIIMIFALVLTYSVGYSNINGQQKEYSKSDTLTVQEAKKFHKEQGEKIILMHPSTKSSIASSQGDFVVDWENASVASDGENSSIEFFIDGLIDDYSVLIERANDPGHEEGRNLGAKLLIIKNSTTGEISQHVIYFFGNVFHWDYKSLNLSLNKYDLYLGHFIIADVNGTPESAYLIRLDGVFKYNITEGADANASDIDIFSIYKRSSYYNRASEYLYKFSYKRDVINLRNYDFTKDKTRYRYLIEPISRYIH